MKVLKNMFISVKINTFISLRKTSIFISEY